ncbi:MAG: serine hydrolase [Saprospiraceae bacterium]
MKIWFILSVSAAVLFGFACSPSKRVSSDAEPLQKILSLLKQDSLGNAVLKNKDQYEIQIIYTQIDRDPQSRPSFRSYWHNVDSTRYFYPASMVKMPLALLSLEKINLLQREHSLQLTKDTPYRLDSLRAWQQAYETDLNAPQKKPCIAHDIRQIFTVSDNLAYNHCFEFLGREYINNSLKAKGYGRTGIMHRFNYPGRDNRYASPITFFQPGTKDYHEAEKFDPNTWFNPQHSTLKGKGYINNADSLVYQPFDFSKKNWFSLTDMEKMLRAVIFPETVPAQNRFDLSAEDHQFLWHYMGIFPRECNYPKYDSSYYDGYAKFLLFGDTKSPQAGSVRVFNKIGQAYGTMTDVAYIVDFEHGVEFILAVTLLCNANGIFNDDHYEYETVGLPFMAKLGRAALDFERNRKREGKPELLKYREALR